MKLLVLDGGGVFGVGQARILDQVDTSKFDAIIGTSIGSANGAMVACDMDVNKTKFFHEKMPKIFRGQWYKKYNPITPRHSDKELNKALKSIFGNSVLGDAKIPLFITAVDTKTEKLKVFFSGDPADAGNKVWETVRCSSAAPTYFNPYKGYVDGGIYANEPSVVGIAGVCNEFGCKLSDIEICTIGTGNTDKRKEILKWSYLSWGIWVLNAALNGSSSTMNDFIARQLPLKKYTRIQFTRESDWSMDSAPDMIKAEVAWKDDIKKGIEIVKDF